MSFACLLLLLAGSAATPGDSLLTAQERRAAIDSLASALIQSYAFPEVGVRLAERLRERQKAGAYDTITVPAAFATRLTSDLAAVAHDKHLSVDPNPVRPSTGGGSPDSLFVEQYNFFFEKVERLAGNIGYFKFNGFTNPSRGSGEVVAGLMAYLANTDALIIDLRENEGGHPGLGVLISSYLFEGNPKPLTGIHWRKGDHTDQAWTLPWVPGRRYVNKDVYIITGRGTFSAAEAFAYDLQALKRATIVGDTTGGGANPGATIRVSERFTAFVPTGNAINPNTGGNWEGKGVIPDVAGPEAEGFVLAYRAALTKLAGHKRGRSVDRETETTLAALNKDPAEYTKP